MLTLRELDRASLSAPAAPPSVRRLRRPGVAKTSPPPAPEAGRTLEVECKIAAELRDAVDGVFEVELLEPGFKVVRTYKKAGRPAEHTAEKRNGYHEFLLGVRAEMARRKILFKGQPLDEDGVLFLGISVEATLDALMQLKGEKINDAEVAIILLQFVIQPRLSAVIIQNITQSLTEKKKGYKEKLAGSLGFIKLGIV